ncbi:MAG: DUF4428 domain-containing protein [Blautia sp.]|nr:DUF4428 domain-containing protein [Blautia sp.]
MGLFDKKYCDVCGEKIGLLGNRKLEDANLCKHCAAKLSPWFNERRHSTLEEIKEQLAYREKNKDAVRQFHTTLTYGRSTKVLIDEDARKFMVTKAKDLEEDNPDVLDFSQVTGCDLDIDENRNELYRTDKDGKSVSYNPPRYEYSYDFYMIIRVNHPYFDEMKFKLNNFSVDTGEQRATETGIRKPGSTADMVGSILDVLVQATGTGGGEAYHPEYQEYLNMGREIRQTLMQARQDVREEAAAANAPKKPMICPHCQASTIPDDKGCCEYCGSSIA